MTFSIDCMRLDRLHAAPNNGGDPILTISLQMTLAQRREALHSLLCDIPEEEAFELVRAEYPEWFEGEGA